MKPKLLSLQSVTILLTSPGEMLRRIILVILIFGGSHGYSQDQIQQDSILPLRMRKADATQNLFPEVIPPSPNASSLGIYGQVPGGHYSGIPQISIPLYEITCGKIKVPITLSYHAAGIRVAQEASWVGLGWSLSAGGVISHSISGADDLNDAFFRGVRGYISAWFFPRHSDDEYLLDENGDISYGASDLWWYTFAMENKHDVKPDMFNYNFAEYSGQLVFKKKPNEMSPGTFPEPMILNRDQLKIKYSRQGAYSIDGGEWVVITPDGTHYHFKTSEQTVTYCDPWSPPANPLYLQPETTTAWYLDKITNPSGDEVEFIYKKTARVKSQVQSSGHVGRGINPFPDDESPWDFSSYLYTINVVDEILLSEIRFRGGKVTFETTDRSDLLYEGTAKPQKLTAINVKDSNGVLIKKYDFTTSYFEGLFPSAENLRLKLDKVVENEEKEWTFAYNSCELPKKTSVEIDYWGYYNGRYHNKIYCMENIPMANFINLYTLDYIEVRADRDASETHTQSGVLTRITYPTGGATDFEYELHDFSNHDFSFNGSDFKYKYDYYSEYISEDSILEVPFTVSDRLPCQIMASVYYSGFNCKSVSAADSPYIDYRYEDFGQLDIVYELQQKRSDGRWTRVSHLTFSNIHCGNINTKGEAKLYVSCRLEPGKYKIIMPTYMNTRAGLEMVVPRLKTYADLKGGGLRIKNIKHYDGIDTLETSYTYALTPGYSSGVVHAFPRTQYIPKVLASPSYGRMSSNIFDLGAPKSGIAVGYDYVRETQKQRGRIICSSEYTFHNAVQDFGHTNKAPNTPTNHYQENGLPKSVVIRNGNGELVQEKYYEYASCQRDSIEGMNITPLYYPVNSKVSLFNFYTYPAEWWYLVSERTVDHRQSYSATETKQYTYDSEHHEITSIETTHPDGKITREEFSYLYYTPYKEDYTIKLPYQQTQYVDGIFKFGNKVLHSELDLWIVKQKTAEMPDYEDRLLVDIYDKYHNPVFLLKDGVEKTVYIWSYLGQYPIAEIKNATATEVARALGYQGSVAAIFSTIAAEITPNMDRIDALRTHLPDAQVTTFTYKPLVGMTTSTDPSGKITYYDYDSTGRLKLVRDNNGNKLQSYEYHYKR